MKNGKRKNEEFHGVEFRTTGSAYEALGFSPEEAAVLEVKNILWHSIRQRITEKKLSTKQLCEVLDAQPSQVSDLRTRKVNKMSLDKLVIYARKLGLVLDLQTRVAEGLRGRAA
ncbi:MAG TPA: XRE family transcriptional regulator [Bdellovibrionota bacterium]|nr:XRE family transcriptional regulator [Bdellovibrionota bacterium]